MKLVIIAVQFQNEGDDGPLTTEGPHAQTADLEGRVGSWLDDHGFEYDFVTVELDDE